MINVQMKYNEMLFPLLYKYLSDVSLVNYSAYSLANHYKQKMWDKKSKMQDNFSDSLGRHNHAAILSLLKCESVKSNFIINPLLLRKISKELQPISICTISIYLFHLRMIMVIALLCNLDLEDCNVYWQLFDLMQNKYGNNFISQIFSNQLIKNTGYLLTTRFLITRNPLLMGVSLLSTLATNSLTTYCFGKKSYLKLSTISQKNNQHNNDNI